MVYQDLNTEAMRDRLRKNPSKIVEHVDKLGNEFGRNIISPSQYLQQYAFAEPEISELLKKAGY